MSASGSALSCPQAMSAQRVSSFCVIALLYFRFGSSSELPADPLTSADPFNPDNDFSWANDQHPPPRSPMTGRFVYLPTKNTPGYTSLFSISGRPCSFMYVNISAELPREGSRIRLSADTRLTFSVIQVSLVGDALAADGLSVRRIYAYICSEDGQWHALSHKAGQWTYDEFRHAEVGLPEYVDGGILAAPRFFQVPSNASVVGERAPCQDRPEWRSLDGQWGCEDYARSGGNAGWCSDVGYLDPSLLDPTDRESGLSWGLAAWQACPRSCRTCFDCAPNETVADPMLLAAARQEGRVVEGCVIGERCPRVLGAQEMFNGAKRAAVFPVEASAELLGAFEALRYSCVAADLSGEAALAGAAQVPLVFEEGVTNEGFLVVRVIAPSPFSVVRYTIDGSEPSFEHGLELPSGGVISLRQSGQIRARAVLLSPLAVTVRQSRIAELPFLQVQIAPPSFRVLQVGHYVKAGTHGGAECGAGFVTSEAQGPYRRVRSNGCPSSEWRTADALNRALHQAWELRLPLAPVLAAEPLSVLGVGGVIGVAADGVPLLAPPAADDDFAFAVEEGMRDACGGLALTVAVPDGAACPGEACLPRRLHHGQYHYRGLPHCLEAAGPGPDGHSPLLAFMLDGIPLYGPDDVAGTPPTDLDSCRGHTDPGRPWYHYHASHAFPFTVACLRGCLDPPSAAGVNAGLAAAQGVCRGGRATTDQRVLERAEWVVAGAQSERGLLLGGRFEGSVSVEMQCPEAATGLADLHFTTDGSDPVPGGAPGQGYGRGAATVVVAENATVRAMCEAEGTLASAVAESGALEVAAVAYNAQWGATAGLWNMSDEGALFGELRRERRRVQGLCSESFDTLVAPARLRDESGGVGALTLSPPDCKTEHDQWQGAQQPNLAGLREERDGVWGVRFDGAGALRGLETEESVTALAGRRALPEEALTVEAWATIEGEAQGEGVLAGVAMRAPGFLGKGWYLGYDRNSGAGTLTLSLVLSTEGSDNFGRGGLAAVRGTVSEWEVGGWWVHVAGTYDGADLRLYLNGTLIGHERACAGQVCGKVTYPVRDGLYVADDVFFGAGGLDLRGQQLQHRGLIAYLRLFRSALAPDQLAAAADRLRFQLQLLRCPLGTAGPYDGLEPCQPCPPGQAGRVQGLSECARCGVGFFAEGPGATGCSMCAEGALTPREGAESAAECTGPDYCQSLEHNCDQYAACVPTAGSFECECLAGFAGDGVTCLAVCGDGVRAAGEECDDGNAVSADGCDSACRQEQGFTCAPPDMAPGGPDSCQCALGPSACCVRGYSGCLARTECEETCFAALTDCLHTAQPLDGVAEVAAAEYLEVPPWDADPAAAACRLSAMKGCALGYTRCTARQREADEGGGGGGGGEEECAANCIGAYAGCVQEVERGCGGER